MSQHEQELESERAYVAGLYERLDAERSRVESRYSAALRGTGASAMERDVEVRAQGRELKRLGVADHGLCFGRLDPVDGESRYIGRIGLFDEDDDYRPLTARASASLGPRTSSPSLHDQSWSVATSPSPARTRLPSRGGGGSFN